MNVNDKWPRRVWLFFFLVELIASILIMRGENEKFGGRLRMTGDYLE